MTEPTFSSAADTPPVSPEETRLSHQGVEPVDRDPAPDIQYRDTHPHVEFLTDKAAEREAFPAGNLEQMDPNTAFNLGYRTAIHDLTEHLMNPGLIAEVISVPIPPDTEQALRDSVAGVNWERKL